MLSHRSPSLRAVRLIHTSDWHLGRVVPPGGAARRPGRLPRPPRRGRARRAGRRGAGLAATSTTARCPPPTPSSCSPRPSPGSSTPVRRWCCQQRQPRLGHPARVRRPACSSGPGCTSAPPSPTSAGRCWSATSRSTPSPTSSRPSPPTRSARAERTHAGVLRGGHGPGARRPSSTAAARSRSSWPTPSSPAASPATPSATSASAASAPVPPAGLRRRRLRRARPPARPPGRSTRRSATAAPRWRCPSARPAHQGQPGWSTCPAPRRRAREHVEAPVRAARSPCCAARSTTCSPTRAHADAEAAWCQVTLTDAVRPLGAMERLRRRFPHTLALQFDPQGAPVAAALLRRARRQRDDLEVCCDFLGHVRGGRGATDARAGRARRGGRGSRLGRPAATTRERPTRPVARRPAGAA